MEAPTVVQFSFKKVVKFTRNFPVGTHQFRLFLGRVWVRVFLKRHFEKE